MFQFLPMLRLSSNHNTTGMQVENIHKLVLLRSTDLESRAVASPSCNITPRLGLALSGRQILGSVAEFFHHAQISLAFCHFTTSTPAYCCNLLKCGCRNSCSCSWWLLLRASSLTVSHCCPPPTRLAAPSIGTICAISTNVISLFGVVQHTQICIRFHIVSILPDFWRMIIATRIEH